jgi:hypothetical protein
MTLQQHAMAARQKRSAERVEKVRTLLAEGEGIKRAAWKAGVSARTARRYRKGWRPANDPTAAHR